MLDVGVLKSLTKLYRVFWFVVHYLANGTVCKARVSHTSPIPNNVMNGHLDHTVSNQLDKGAFLISCNGKICA